MFLYTILELSEITQTRGNAPSASWVVVYGGLFEPPIRSSWISLRARNIGIHILPNLLYSLLMVLTRRICWKIRSFLNW